MDISAWQKRLSAACWKRFGKDKKPEDRVFSCIRQLADITGALQTRQGTYQDSKREYRDLEHRIACLIADTLILAEKCNVDLNTELNRVAKWFESQEPVD